MCPQPTPGNLIKNPGFDTDLSGWTVTPNAGSVFWDPSDALNCPFSGRARLWWPEGAVGYEEGAPRISTCVPVKGSSSYNVGVRTHGGTFCDFNAYPTATCAGSAIYLTGFAVLFDGWPSFQDVVKTPADAMSAEIVCYPYDKRDWEFSFDMAYFSPAPSLY
jgi:hypothetical protein